MVTRSTTNYKKWKKEVYEVYKNNFGEYKAETFMAFVSSRYDKFNRSYLPHKVMWRLYDLHRKVIDKNQHQVYGAFGRGGTGKTTLLKNILYFHDPTFDHSRVAKSMDDFVPIVYEILKKGHSKSKYKAILIDEPSKSTHQASETWRFTEDVLGQIRQANLFLGVASTELRNVKSSVYSLITGMFAFRNYFVYDYYDEEKKEGIMGQVVKEYKKTNTYEVFHNKGITKYANIKNVKSYKDTPIDSQEKKYLKGKRKEFMSRVEKLLTKIDNKKHGKPTVTEIEKLIIKKRKNGKTLEEIGKDLDISKEAVHQRIKRLEEKNIILVKV